MDFFLGIIQAYPRTSIIVISIVISFLISLVNYLVLDKAKVRELKERQKKIREEMKTHQKAGNHDKVLALQKDTLSDSMELMRHSLKPTLITMIPVIFIFAFLRGHFGATEIAKTWIWYYIGTAITSSIIFRKLMNLP